MKKEIVCPVCGRRGFVSWINTTENSCYSGSQTCPHCNGEMMVDADVTNADHIRSMTDEELAKILVFWEDDWGRWWTDAGCVYDDTKDHHERAVKAELDWLKQPYKGENK